MLISSFFRKQLFADALQNSCIRKRLQHRCFSVNIAKFLRTAFYRTSLVAASVLRRVRIRHIVFLETHRAPENHAVHIKKRRSADYSNARLKRQT